MQRVLLLLVILISFNAGAETLNVEDVIREAKTSTGLSDHFRALRLYDFLKDSRPKSFYLKGVSDYLETQSVLKSLSGLETECEQIAKNLTGAERDSVNYTCGKIFFEAFQLLQAEKFFEKVSDKYSLRLQTLIYKASLFMGNAESEKCIKILDVKFVKKSKNTNIKDLFYLTRARCFVQQNEIDKAILEYHLISATSPFYYYALEELAWTQFKVRHFESVRTLLDVIITTYETGLGERRSVPPSIYFRSRYLLAYSALVQKNNKLAEEHFNSLKATVTKFTTDKIIDDAKAKKMAMQISNENIKWLDTKAIPREINAFLGDVKEWADSRIYKKLERTIEMEFALSRELKRIKELKNSEYDNYQKDLDSLEKLNRKQLEDEFIRASRSVERSLRIIRIKAELGSIELVWSSRAQGMRSIGELLDSYQSQINEVEDFF